MELQAQIAVLEVKVSTIEKAIETMVTDIKGLQNRWAMICGAMAIISNLPQIIGFFNK